MIFSVASQRTSAAEISRARVHWSRRQARRRCDVVAVEIDQFLRVRHSVRIVAGRARGFLVDNVKAMSPALTQAVYRAKALITEDAVAAVAFIAEGIVRRAFRSVVCED